MMQQIQNMMAAASNIAPRDVQQQPPPHGVASAPQLGALGTGVQQPPGQLPTMRAGVLGMPPTAAATSPHPFPLPPQMDTMSPQQLAHFQGAILQQMMMAGGMAVVSHDGGSAAGGMGAA